MIQFKIIKKSKNSRARLGILKTSCGEIETPAFVPVATNAVVKTLESNEALEAKSQILIANTFHLHLRPGEKAIKNSGGLHKFMNWPKPLMTDSGGFQVFSLGFGRDLQVGKVLKFFPEAKNKNSEIKKGDQPKFLKITERGVYFNSPLDGAKLFLGPDESIKIQESLGADIIFAFDECTPPLADYEYARSALKRTHQWAKICISAKKTKQALFGIIQGSKFKDLRIESAKFIDSLGFEGYGIGGDLGTSKKTILQILNWVLPNLNPEKPRHLLGIGHPEDMEMAIKSGIDTYDCIAPTHYARHGTAFVSSGKLNLEKSLFLKDKNPLDKKCSCRVCQTYSRSYIAHLVKAKEITGLKLLTFHNLHYFNSLAESIRQKIKNGKI